MAPRILSGSVRVGPEIEELEGGQVLVEGLPVVVVETVPPVARDRAPPQPAVAGHVEAVVRGVEEGAVEVRVNGLGARCPDAPVDGEAADGRLA